MKKVITMAELYSGVLPEVPDGLIAEMDLLLGNNLNEDPLQPIKINLSDIEGLMLKYEDEVDSKFGAQRLLQAIVAHYGREYNVSHEKSVLSFGTHFEESGRYPLRTNIQLHQHKQKK